MVASDSAGAVVGKVGHSGLSFCGVRTIAAAIAAALTLLEQIPARKDVIASFYRVIDELKKPVGGRLLLSQIQGLLKRQVGQTPFNVFADDLRQTGRAEAFFGKVRRHDRRVLFAPASANRTTTVKRRTAFRAGLGGLHERQRF